MNISAVSNQGIWYDSSKINSNSTMSQDEAKSAAMKLEVPKDSETEAQRTRKDKEGFDFSMYAMLGNGIGMQSSTIPQDSVTLEETDNSLTGVAEESGSQAQLSVQELLEQLKAALTEKQTSSTSGEDTDDTVDQILSQLKERLEEKPPMGGQPPMMGGRPPMMGGGPKPNAAGGSVTETDSVSEVEESTDTDEEETISELLERLAAELEESTNTTSTSTTSTTSADKTSDDAIKELLAKLEQKLEEQPPMGGQPSRSGQSSIMGEVFKARMDAYSSEYGVYAESVVSDFIV